MPRRRLLETVLALAVALAVLAPMMLGPAFAPLARALGGDGEHRCACGMVQGTCGCPECARIEHQRVREHAPFPYPVLRSQCEGDEVAPGFAALPVALAAPEGLVIARAVEARVLPIRPPQALSRESSEPTTPPPRDATV
jgi:hypothetical protein